MWGRLLGLLICHPLGSTLLKVPYRDEGAGDRTLQSHIHATRKPWEPSSVSTPGLKPWSKAEVDVSGHYVNKLASNRNVKRGF